MYSIDRASTIASRAVASSSTRDERGRFPINRQSHQSIRSAPPDACAFSTRVGHVTTDHDSSLTPPPQISLSTTKSNSNTHRSGPIDRSIEGIDRTFATEPTEPIEPIEPIDRPRRHSRARRWRHDDDLDDVDDDDDDAVVGGVEERGETGGESSGERVGGIGTTRYAR